MDRNDLDVLGTIAHNDLNCRVTLYAGTDGNIWAAAPGDELHDTETPIGHEELAWSGVEWDYRPA